MFQGHRRVVAAVSATSGVHRPPRRWAAAIVGGVIVLAVQLVTAAPAAADPGGNTKPPQQAYAAPTLAPQGKGKAADTVRPLTLADKRPTRKAGTPGVNVVGGGRASVGEYPYFASIWRAGASPSLPVFACGGSLLSVQMVLTAAHCVDDGIPLSAYQVRIGGTQLSGADTGVVRNVGGVTFFPGWPIGSPPPPGILTRFDVAILYLSSPITRADATAQWLRLAQGNELGLVDVGDSATLVGHGNNEPLTELPVPIQPDSAASYPAYDPGMMFGAGGTAAGGQGACGKDEGGPLVITSTPQHVQIGNLSWYTGLVSPTTGCALPNRPDVYGELYQGALAGYVNSVVNPTRPYNDQFASAATLSGESGSLTGNNTNATLEPSESGTDIETTVWYRWKPTKSGTAQITVNQHGFDSEVRVYTGSTASTLTLVAANNDANGSLQSEVEFPVVEGKIYQIQVDGFQFDYGPFRLSYAVGRPANDDFAGATAITDTCACPVVASTVNATGQAGEAYTAAGDGDATLWYSWTASAPGVARFTTAGSNFVTTLTAYTGTELTGLTQVATNLYFNGTTQSQITFLVPEAGTYRIRVGGYNGARGELRLQYALEPEPNDLFVQPQVLAGPKGVMTGSNERALAEPGEPASLRNPTSTVWYSWTAPASGTYRFTTVGSTFDTELAALTGATVTGLTLLAFNDDAIDTQSAVSFAATAGTTYWIWVDGFGCEKGAIQLDWDRA